MITIQSLWDAIDAYDGGQYNGNTIMVFELDGVILGDRVAFDFDSNGHPQLMVSAWYGGDGAMCLTFNGFCDVLAETWPPDMEAGEVRVGTLSASRQIVPTRMLSRLSISEDYVEDGYKTIMTFF